MHLRTLAILITILLLKLNIASAYSYEKRSADNHILHIITINPTEYRTNIVKASGNGREEVSLIAENVVGAEVAINGGFFEIDENANVKPNGTLVVNGKIQKVKNRIQGLAIVDSGTFSVHELNPKTYLSEHSNCSIVSGIPMLINEGKILKKLHEKHSDFYTKAHARTAIGTKADGMIVLVVAEHHYKKDMQSITIGEVNSLIQEKGRVFAQKYSHDDPGKLTISELKSILKDEFMSPNGAQGLTIIQLAELMKQLGCMHAMNLDGGGSSTLWINGKVVNKTVGDKDEGNGKYVIRPVLDAIVFSKGG